MIANSLVWCSVIRLYLYQNTTTVDSLQRKASQYFCQPNKTLLCYFLPCWQEITRRILPALFFSLFSHPASRQKRKCWTESIELANRRWQCCFSEVWVTLERRRVCRWKIQSRCESRMQNNLTDAEWIILTLWSGQIISGILLCLVWRDTKEGQTWKRKMKNHFRV